MKLFKTKTLGMSPLIRGIYNFNLLNFTESKKENTKVKFTDVYKTNNKMQKPDIGKWVDMDKFIHGNVTIETKKTLNSKSKSKTNTAITNPESNTSDNTTLPNKEKEKEKEKEKAIAVPISPKLGPFEILNPKIDDKSYHWCSCGLSKKQPFCDRSHKGTSFKPINFKVGEKVDKMILCGCKLSTKAPFCDGETCINLSAKYEETLQEKINKINEKEVKPVI